MLAVAAALGVLGALALAALFRALEATPPMVPWLSPVALFVLVAFVGWLARSVHVRVQKRRERVEPSRAVAWLALGKAAALGGAVVAGGYLGYALSFITRLDAAAPRERVVFSAWSVVAGIALTVAGLALERACRVPGDEENPEDAENTP
ncbi:DUF3180 domain-containing protein [Desertihabitans aurantiacus]|uniref:DUF3180 domain-containing protein n=1 Tax=Desertihabitans aurantiacus TaxID=2282477 RepID=UPI00130097F2|nr:DUF3180 domain-containing protein [Desertihabitans aurantiacus]